MLCCISKKRGGNRKASTHIIIVHLDSSSLLLWCHPTCSTAPGYRPYSSPTVTCECLAVCVFSSAYWSSAAAQNARGCSQSCSLTPPPLSLEPSILGLIIFAKSTINLIFWSLAMTSLQSINFTNIYIKISVNQGGRKEILLNCCSWVLKSLIIVIKSNARVAFQQVIDVFNFNSTSFSKQVCAVLAKTRTTLFFKHPSDLLEILTFPGPMWRCMED